MMHPARLLAVVSLAGLASACGSAPERGPFVTPASREARPVVSVAPVRNSRPSDDIETRLLEAHNSERGRVGSQPLIWSDDLEAEARAWARELIATGRFAHDPGPHGHGENLWTGWGSRRFTPEEMVGEWIAEKADYQPGVFPQVSRTGDWTRVGHYTQLVWRDTTHVGCALETRGDQALLACRYAPPGNIDGRRAY